MNGRREPPADRDDPRIVVCVDDQPEVLAALRRTLRSEPYELRTTESPATALQWAAEVRVNVLVTDERLAGERGTHLIAVLRERSPDTACVVLTAYPGSETVRHALPDAIDCLIGKPWNDEALRLTIRGLLDNPRTRGREGGRERRDE